MKVPYGYLNRQFDAETAERIWQTAVKRIVTSGDFTLGQAVRDFEAQFAHFIGSRFCIGVANGTDALELALWVHNFEPGSEVIVPVNTFIASAASIVTAGLRPVFVDTDEAGLINPALIEPAITNKTRAILPVHFGGRPCDMKSIMEIALKHGLAVIEDAAQAANAFSNAGPCGTVGDIAAVSFHPQKNLNCWGDGGAILTDNEVYYEQLQLYRNHGMLTRDDYAFASRNSRLDSIHAAVLSYFLPALPADNNRRIDIAAQYNAAFDQFARVPVSADRHTYHLYMMYLRDPARRDALLKYLQYSGVDARIHYPKPLHLQPAFEFLRHKAGDFPNAEAQAASMISLPIHQYMEPHEVGAVIAGVQDYYG